MDSGWQTGAGGGLGRQAGGSSRRHGGAGIEAGRWDEGHEAEVGWQGGCLMRSTRLRWVGRQAEAVEVRVAQENDD